jgi:hypothetical protein
MNKTRYLVTILCLAVLAQCKTSKSSSGETANIQYKAVISRDGLLSCFEQGLTANGQPVWCEASAIVYDGRKLLLANDKDMPDKRSSVFYWPFKNGFADTTQPVHYLENPVLKYAKKYEDFALTPDGKTVFLTTAFDRVKPESSEWNAYNTILYWQVGNENNPVVLRMNNADSSSVFLREKFSRALTSAEFPAGMPYFKIEGIAATSDQLYFGVREEGKKFDDFKYKIKIITAPYQMRNDTVELGTAFKVLADIDVASLEPTLKKPMGLSSIEYDRYNKRFLLLTSFEDSTALGGYLWTASQTDLENNKINLVRDMQGNPLAFTNKSEDIAVINRKKILVIHDDDRTKTMVSGQVRQPNQAAFSIVEFK